MSQDNCVQVHELSSFLKLLVQPSVLAMLLPSYASEFGKGKLISVSNWALKSV